MVNTEPKILKKPVTMVQLREQHATRRRGKDHMVDLASTLFDQTRQIHHLTDDHKRLLIAAVLLQDLTEDQDLKTFHKTSSKVIRSHDLSDLSVEEQKQVAALVRYQRGKVKRGAIAKIVSGSPMLTNEILILVAMLRITLGLGQSRDRKTRIQALQVTPDMLHLVVRGTYAASDSAAAQENSDLWAKACHQILVIEPSEEMEKELDKASKNLPFPTPMKSPGIGSWDPMAEAGRKVLRYHFAIMVANEAGTIQGKDIEALHDMRVATRRMRAAFEAFAGAYDSEKIKSFIAELRLLGRVLGTVRDLDVFMVKAQDYQEKLEKNDQQGLDPLTQAWKEEHEAARSEMIAHLESRRYYNFTHRFNLFLHTPGAAALPVTSATPYLVCQEAPVLIYNRLAVVRSYESILSSPSIDQLHELRIVFKRLRYTVEYFREVLGPESADVIAEIKQFQDHLGDLNDADVACRILSGFLQDWEKRQSHLLLDERQDPEPVAAYLAAQHSERHRLMVSFKDAWGEFVRSPLRRNLAMAISIL